MIKITQEHKQIIENSIRNIPDFPKLGINFKDITTLLNDNEAFGILMRHLKDRYQNSRLDYVVGLDARGFIFGAILANILNIGFVPIRKKGKLPSTTISRKYELEYGFSELEIHKDAFKNKTNSRILIIDDLLATGGTAQAACELVKELNAQIIEICFIVNLKSLNGINKINNYAPIYSVIEY